MYSSFFFSTCTPLIQCTNIQLTLSMLDHCVDTESMDSLLNTFCRHIIIWNCMNVMPTIVKALDTAHQVWKLRGIQCRPLLALIIRFDSSRHLSEASRESVESDLAAFTLVSNRLLSCIVCVNETLVGPAANCGACRTHTRSFRTP